MYRPKTPNGSIRVFRGPSPTSPVPATPKAYDPEEAQRLVQALVPFADRPVDALGGEDLVAYQAYVRFAKGLYASENYKEFYDISQKTVEGVRGAPGSVAAYIQGCKLETSVLPSGCSVVCQGALPAPGTAGADLCAHPVYQAEVVDGAYRFKALHGQRIGLSSTALVLVPPGFKGFVEGERAWLARHASDLKVFEVDDDGTTVPVTDATRARGGARVLTKDAPQAPQVVDSYYMLVLVAIALLLLIIGFAFLNSNLRFFRNA